MRNLLNKIEQAVQRLVGGQPSDLEDILPEEPPGTVVCITLESNILRMLWAYVLDANRAVNQDLEHDRLFVQELYEWWIRRLLVDNIAEEGDYIVFKGGRVGIPPAGTALIVPPGCLVIYGGVTNPDPRFTVEEDGTVSETLLPTIQ
jgi:hypothetical protein